MTTANASMRTSRIGIALTTIGCLGMAAVVIGAFFMSAMFVARRSEGVDASERAEFVNRRENLSGPLAENYADFRFSYPASWTLIPSDGMNFVKVEHARGGTTLENIAFGYFGGGAPADDATLSGLLGQLEPEFARGFPGYRKLSEGRTTFGRYPGYELRFEARLEPPGRAIPLWGRVILLPPADGETNGVSVVTLATAESDEVEGPEDLGSGGGLATVAESFRFGRAE